MSADTQNMGGGTDFSGITRSGLGRFPNPFFDIASEYMPRHMPTIFEFCEYLYLTYGTFRSASRKVVRYFLTEIYLEGEDTEDYNELLNTKLHMLSELAAIGDDFMVYGNVFISVFFPFDRLLICNKCRTHYNINNIAYKFSLPRLEFHAECPKCQYRGVFDHEDIRSTDTSRVKIKRWNPKRMKMRVHPISNDIEYYYEIEPKLVDRIREGNRFYLNNTPWDIVKCCQGSASSQPLLFFDPGAIYHLKEPTLSGLPIVGWGIPPGLPNFKLAYYIQVLRRADEAIALDYIVPFRVLYPDMPAQAGANTDGLQMLAMGNFNAQMAKMVQAKRSGSTDIQLAPFKVGYEMLGGEGQALMPKDSIAQATDELLNALGYPAELYRGSLQLQAFPVALRLFEKTWGALVDGYNDVISYVTERVGRYYGWDTVKASLRSVTLADDIERKALMLQAAAGMDVSKGTAYRPLGLDFMAEQEKIVEEQREIAQLQQEAAEEQAQDQYSGGGAPGAPQGGGATPGDIQQQAQDLAQQLVMQTPETLRRGELLKIKRSNPTLHALVMQAMSELRNELSRQGQAMMLSQAQQGPMPKAARAIASSFPSPMALGILLASELGDYSRQDFRRLAQPIDIKQASAPGKESPELLAFRYVFRQARGW